MNTQQNDTWIEPKSGSEINPPSALLESGSDRQMEITEPPDSSRGFATAHICEDTGGYELCALDDW